MEFAVVATIVSCFSQIPQAIRSLQTGKTTDISPASNVLFIVSSILWTVSSILDLNVPLCANSVITAVCQIVVFVVYVRQKRKEKKTPTINRTQEP